MSPLVYISWPFAVDLSSCFRRHFIFQLQSRSIIFDLASKPKHAVCYNSYKLQTDNKVQTLNKHHIHKLVFFLIK